MPSNAPTAEIDIDDELVRTLLRNQHPELADLPIALLANGWDNTLFRLGDELVARLPRRRAGVALVENEQRWLPVIAPRIHTPIPVPVRHGRPDAGYPWNWSIVPWIGGDPAATVPLTEFGTLPEDLAGFVRDLHVPAPADHPVNPVRGIPLATRTATLEERLATGEVPRTPMIRELWAAALAAPRWPGPALWIHGDLHAANILVKDRALAGVIDFGDITAGDPATDLATAWLTFDAAGRRAFRSALDYDDATWLRAAAWAASLAAAVITLSAVAPGMVAVGEQALEQLAHEL